MTGEDDDRDLLHLYRAQARELPRAALDANILAAARTADKRWWMLLCPPPLPPGWCWFSPPRHDPQTPAAPAHRYRAGRPV